MRSRNIMLDSSGPEGGGSVKWCGEEASLCNGEAEAGPVVGQDQGQAGEGMGGEQSVADNFLGVQIQILSVEHMF